jgi:hypothetical protein
MHAGNLRTAHFLVHKGREMGYLIQKQGLGQPAVVLDDHQQVRILPDAHPTMAVAWFGLPCYGRDWHG